MTKYVILFVKIEQRRASLKHSVKGKANEMKILKDIYFHLRCFLCPSCVLHNGLVYDTWISLIVKLILGTERLPLLLYNVVRFPGAVLPLD